jgi:glycosyltransferase involved in cell wall biosynthesis
MSRILQIHTHYREAGGEDEAAAADARLLAEAGHEVLRYRAWNARAAPKAAAQLAVSAWNPSATRTIRRLVKQHRPEIAHVHNTWFALSPSILGELRANGVPVIMSLHNYRLMCSNALLFRSGRPCEDCVGTHPWHGVKYRCYRGSLLASAAAAANIAVHDVRGTWLREVDSFLCPSEFSKRPFVAAGIPPHKLIVRPNFVEDPGTRITAPSESRQVLFVGRISAEKGILELLEAWRQATLPGLELLVVGEGPLLEQAHAGAGKNVRVMGRIERAEVGKLMLSSRALVLPSVAYEVQPTVLLEALAAGLPVLASDAGGNPEVLREIGREWLVRPGRVEEWSLALSGLLEDSVVDAYGNRSRAIYCRRFTPEMRLRNLERAYSAALARTSS